MNSPKYLPPLDPDLALRVASLTEDQIEWWSERSALREYSGGLPRAEAEALAWEDTARHFGLGSRSDQETSIPAHPRLKDRK